jgi:hypothetical protein
MMNLSPKNLRRPIRILMISGVLLAWIVLVIYVQGVQAVDTQQARTFQDDTSWIDEHIENLRPRLIAEGKNCQHGGINYYRSCLGHQAAVGVTHEEAIKYCAGYLEQIIAAMPVDPMGGSGLKGNTSYAWEVDEMTFSYEGRGGSADGTMRMVTIPTLDHCHYTITIVFSGSFEYETCSFQGDGTYSWTCQVDPAVGGECLLCGDHGEIPGDPGTWTAELKDNEIRGHFSTTANKNRGAYFYVKMGEPGLYSHIEESGFLVKLSCSPAHPEVDQKVTCTAELRGADENEDIDYTWYVDSAKEADTKEGSWTWGSAEKGVHDITVYVQGEGHDTESTVTLEVGEEAELVASIGMDPPLPVVEKGVTFTPKLEGVKEGEKLKFRWFVDRTLLCETAICTWPEAAGGSHQIQLEVRGDGERISVAQRQFDVVNLVDEKEAGFRIVGLGCNSGVSSDETLVCSLGLERDEGVGPLNVTWLIDGVVASTEPGVEAGSEMQLGQPAPGEHGVSAVVVEPVKGIAISGQTTAEVIEGKNALIPPWRQAATAGGTLGVVGAWLWMEWMNARWAQAEEERLRQLQKPSWVHDPRSLEEIWAADVEAERQRRGLWGFEYNKEAGIFKQPDWTYSENAPWWWGDSDDAYQKLRQSFRDAEPRADRSLEQEWLREIYQESSAKRRLEDQWIYKQKIDAWEKAPWHPDNVQKRIWEGMLKTDRAIDAIVDKLPVSQWGTIEALQEKLLAAGVLSEAERAAILKKKGGSVEAYLLDKYERMLRMRGAVYKQMQAQYEREKVGADLEAIGWQEWEVGAARVKTGATIASTVIAFSPMVLGVAGWATGAATLTNAAAAVSGAMAKLGAFRLTMNLVEGATVGYLEGGMSTAVVGGMKRTLPINTMSLWLGPRMPGDKGPGWKRIGLSLLQDFGNAMTLKRGIGQYKQLARRAGESLSNAYQRLTGTGEQPLRMPPVRNNVLLKQDAQWWAEREQGQRLVNNFNQTLRKMNQATSRLERANLSNQLTREAIKINESYAAKSIMKVIKRPGLTKAFDQRIQRIYRVVDHRVAKQLSSEGFSRGGRAFSRTDLTNFRNAKSYGTVGMDRDVGLNEMLVKKWEGVVKQAQPGTAWHAHATAKLQEAQRVSRLTVGGQRISLGRFNDRAQEIYEKVYGQVTGSSAKKAFQTFTTSNNVEAYKDLKVLQNNPMETPFSGQWAEQTGSVSAVKVYENFKLADQGIISEGSAIQESARGLAKDISTKLIPLLKANPSVNPQQISYWQGVQKVLGQVGKGDITPGQLLETMGEDKSGIVRMAEQVSAGIQGAIRSQ